jgi:glycogen operon protein
VLSQVKLIAEPWDVGDGGYQLGNFYPEWSEWNDKYRDYIRDFWRPSDAKPAEFAQRFMGSPDYYTAKGRFPAASLNLITSHDGFTLQDLVSYEEAHNEANRAGKAKSLAASRAWNCGIEGPTEAEEIVRCRAQQKRNLLATLLLSQGIPMLVAGDEFGRTQGGNDNAFCQDNPISWLDWASADERLIDFTARLISIRKSHPVFQVDDWLGDTDAMSWLDTAGRPIEDWDGYSGKTFAAYYGAGLFIAFNAEASAAEFKLPDRANWKLCVSTSLNEPEHLLDRIMIPTRSMAVLLAQQFILYYKM